MTELLSYEGFKHLLESRMAEAFAKHGVNVRICTETMLKDNDRQMEAIVVEHGTGDIKSYNYVEQMYTAYQCGESIEQILEGTVAQTLPVLKQQASLSSFWETLAEWEKVRPLIGCRLINAEANRARLKDQCHTRTGEFAVSYYVKTGMAVDGNAYYAMPIREHMRIDWNVSLNDLHKAALENMDLPNNYILELTAQHFVVNGPVPQWFTLTSKDRINGATVLVSEEVLEQVKNRLGGDFYIVPTTIHELMVLKKKSREELRFLQLQLRQLNREYSYKDQEYLSNYVYEYNSAKRKLLRAM